MYVQVYQMCCYSFDCFCILINASEETGRKLSYFNHNLYALWLWESPYKELHIDDYYFVLFLEKNTVFIK